MNNFSYVASYKNKNAYFDKFLDICSKGNLDEIKKMYYGKNIFHTINFTTANRF